MAAVTLPLGLYLWIVIYTVIMMLSVICYNHNMCTGRAKPFTTLLLSLESGGLVMGRGPGESISAGNDLVIPMLSVNKAFNEESCITI